MTSLFWRGHSATHTDGGDNWSNQEIMNVHQMWVLRAWYPAGQVESAIHPKLPRAISQGWWSSGLHRLLETAVKSSAPWYWHSSTAVGRAYLPKCSARAFVRHYLGRGSPVTCPCLCFLYSQIQSVWLVIMLQHHRSMKQSRILEGNMARDSFPCWNWVERLLGWGCGSLVKFSPSIFEGPALIPTMTEAKQWENEQQEQPKTSSDKYLVLMLYFFCALNGWHESWDEMMQPHEGGGPLSISFNFPH